MQNYLKQTWILLIPSWLSGLIAMGGSLAVTIGIIVISSYQGSALQQQLFEARGGRSTASVLGLQTIADNLSQNRIIDNLPLFLFWAVLGVIVYLFVIGIWNAFSTAVELHEEMSYVHASRQQLIRQAAQHTIFRLIILGLWLLYLRLFLRLLLPYGLAAAHVATHLNISAIVYAVVAVVDIAVALHIHVVLLRLLLTRLRIVGEVVTDYQSSHDA